MLRPATPLTILLFISFVLLLLSVISTPVVRGITIATYENVHFGVFGYCTPSECSGIRVGYTTDGLFGNAGDGDFNLPSSARNSLSSLLIVHPVAAFFNLVCLALAAAAHLHSPSHSARYLLGLLILLLPTLLVTLLAFLVDILLFVPHLQWGGWIVLASTILITASGVVTCAMRRTLVSRKARKKRIAENAEMSGENFYNRQAAEAKMPQQTFSEPPIPLVNGQPGGDRLPAFATFETGKRSDDEQSPLTAAGMSNDPTLVSSRDGASERFYDVSSRTESRPRPEQPGQFGDAGPPLPMPMPVQGRRSGEDRRPGPYREGSIPPPRGGAYGPRGRGGYPPRGGGYPPRGGGYGPRAPPPNGYGRGGFSTEMRGGYGGRGRGGYPPAGMPAGAMMSGGQPRPPPGYRPNGPNASYGPPDEYSDRLGPPAIATSVPFIEGANDSHIDRVTSPSVYTQAPDEQRDAYGARVQSPAREYGSRVQSPASAGRRASPPPVMPPIPGAEPAVPGRSPPHSPVQEQYVPPRAHWNNAAGQANNDYAPRSPTRYTVATGSQVAGYTSGRPSVHSRGSDIYYEDVDPRFANEADNTPSMPTNNPNHAPVPPLLMPGHGPGGYRGDNMAAANSYEDLPGALSPAESEGSNFTSISQRGVNPNWRPGYGGEFSNLGPRRGQNAQMKRDVLLAGNPDFEIPGMGSGRGRDRGPMRGGFGRGPPPASLAGMGADGRYPMGPPPMGPGAVREI